MPASPARSQSMGAMHDDAFAVPIRRRPAPTRTRATGRWGGWAVLHLASEMLFGVGLAVGPALIGLPLGVAALGAIMGALIAVTALSSPASRLPMVGSPVHDRMGIDALLVGLAAMLWVVGENGAMLLVAAAAVHVVLTLAPGRLGARR